MVFEPFTALSALVGAVRLGFWIVKKLTRKKNKEDEIRRAELRLSEKMENVLAALEAHEKLALFHVGSFAKRDGISHRELQNILSQGNRSLFLDLKKIEDAGRYVLKLPEYVSLGRAASKLKNETINALIALFQRKAQANPIRRPLAITNVEENRYRSEHVLSSGDRHTGHWRVVNGRYIEPDGWGMRKYRTGGTYEGGWSKGKRHGYGVRRWPDGGKYSGDWKNDKKDGKGKQKYADGAKYDGYWKDNKRSGYGRLIYPDWREYMGNWKDDYRHGDNGTNIWSDGRRYTGSWAKGKRNGHGTMRWVDGSEYNGEWKHDVREGYGVYTSARGNKDVGNWKNNKLVTTTRGKAGNKQGAYIASWEECQPSIPGRGLPQFGAHR